MNNKSLRYVKRILSFILAFIMVFTSMPVTLFDLNNEAQAAGTGEIDNRETVYFPSDSLTGANQTFYIPRDPTVEGTISDHQDGLIVNDVIRLTRALADSGYAESIETINLIENDYVWIFHYNAPQISTRDANASKDGGFTFSLHNNQKNWSVLCRTKCRLWSIRYL